MLGKTRNPAPEHHIGPGAIFEGTFRFSGRLHLEGTVTGAVIADPVEGSEVMVGLKGRIEGRLSAATAVISGIVQGPVHASVRLDVLAGARIRGDIEYRDLQVQHGALVEGSLKPIEGEQVALKLVANSRI
jgi:cytoskeletal protein CcmA (bactofilin family)